MFKHLFKRFLSWLDRRGRRRVVLDRFNKEPYLERYYLFLRDRKWFPFNVFLHKFLKSDPDDVHDHPWPYFTLILRGGYWEWKPIFNANGEVYMQYRIWRGPGHFRFCLPKSFHRIELEPGVTPWTLFIPGPQVREWGFHHKGRWIQHDRYLKDRLFR